MIYPYKLILCNHLNENDLIDTGKTSNINSKIFKKKKTSKLKKNIVNNILPFVRKKGGGVTRVKHMHTRFAYTSIKFLWKDILLKT